MRSDLFFCLSFGVFQHHLYRAAPGQVAFEFVAATGDCFNRLYWHELSRPAQIYSECALHCGSHTAARLLHSFQVFQYSHRIARTFFLQPFFCPSTRKNSDFSAQFFSLPTIKFGFVQYNVSEVAEDIRDYAEIAFKRTRAPEQSE